MQDEQRKNGAPFENKNGVKLKDPEVRQLAYSQYCEHLSKGKSKKSWYFQHPELRCTWETMEKYLLNEVEFDPTHKQIALAKGYGFWESVVEDSAIGKNDKANTASLQMLMRNKFGWDRDAEKKEAAGYECSKVFDSLMGQLNKYQSESKNILAE